MKPKSTVPINKMFTEDEPTKSLDLKNGVQEDIRDFFLIKPSKLYEN